MRKGVLFIIENLPIPLDRRVLLEASAIRSQKIPVYIICPGGRLPLKRRETLDNGIEVFRYSSPPETRGYLSFLMEFGYCLAVTFILVSWIFARHGFHVIHAANPPDTFFTVGLFFRLLGVKYVFDQHDLCPELFTSRFRRTNRFLLKLLYTCEKFSYRTARLVISPNESYREIALTRGRVPPRRISVVRSAPDDTMLESRQPVPSLKQGSRWLMLYLGVMGPQDGVDILIQAYAALLRNHSVDRKDILMVLIGDGDAREELEISARNLGIDDRLIFTGFMSGSALYDYLATADLGVSPDPPTPFNELSTMNKVMEYMAYGVPVVSFDLKETRHSAGDAAHYVARCTPDDLASAIRDLLNDPDRRRRMGETGRKRILETFNWNISRQALIAAYRDAGLLDRRETGMTESVAG